MFTKYTIPTFKAFDYYTYDCNILLSKKLDLMMFFIQKLTKIDNIKMSLNVKTKEKYLSPASKNEEVIYEGLFDENEMAQTHKMENSLFYKNYMKTIEKQDIIQLKK